MNPVVLIATHDRIDITRRNIESLQNQTLKPEIVLIVSLKQDYDAFKDLGIKLVTSHNNPLGLKWQTGVQFAMKLKPDPLILTGSDDILGKTYVERACFHVSNGIDFIGLKSFWQHHKGIAYLCKYLANQPIGGGRVYSAKMLRKLGGRIFDVTKSRHLDDYGWMRVFNTAFKKLLIMDIESEGMEIHAIKGDWQVMNPFVIHHKNIQLLRQRPSEYIKGKYRMSETGNSFVNDDLA